MMKPTRALLSATAVLGFFATAATAAGEDDYEAYLDKYVYEFVKPVTSAPEVIAAVHAQNAAHAGLTDAQIDALDRQWRAERKAGGGRLVNATMFNSTSNFLKGFKAASGGVISELFVMDNKGLNVAQTDPTGDYMQGDEDKWIKTYAAGPWMSFTDQPEEEDGVKIVQVSMTIVDNDKAIGAITIGINLGKLPRK